MAHSEEVTNHQALDLLVLSRRHHFGARRAKTPLLSQAEVDARWVDLPINEYSSVDGPFTLTGGVAKFKTYEHYDTYAPWKGNNLAFVGALEYLSDIRPLVSAIRQELLKGNAVDLFIGYKGGYYEWSTRTAETFLVTMGITVKVTKKLVGGVVKLTLACKQVDYDTFLEGTGLPAPGFSHLMVTTEHSGYRVTGGIGSYVKECDNLYGDDVAILILDSNTTLDIDKIRAHRWMTPQAFLGPQRVDEVIASNYDTYGDVVEEALECILALYSGIESIESQEMLLNRTIDAKAILMLPPWVKLITTCHGSSLHLAKAKRTVLDAENIHVAYREKYTLEHSDIVVFPTNYLQRSYIDSGVENLGDASRIKKRLPFDFSRLPVGGKLERYERFLYIGKTSTIKGFDLFLETLLEIQRKNPTITEQVKEVVIMATSVDIVEPYLKLLYNRVKELYNVKIVSLDREVLLKTLAEYSANTLALISYRGDNHPLAVLELMAIGHDFIAVDAAGTPELILPGFEAHNLAPAHATAYAEAIQLALRQSEKRSKKVVQLRTHYLEEQKLINESYSVKALRQLPVYRPAKRTRTTRPTVHVTIVGDTKSAAYQATQRSLIAQTYELAVVAEAHENTKDTLRLRLYAGDLLYPDCIELMVMLYESSETIGVVMVDELVMAYGGDGTRRGTEEFHPYPPELGSVFLQEKYSRRMISLFDETYLDDAFTDWQKAIAAACEGRRVAVVPRLLAEVADVDGYFSDDTIDLASKFAHSFTALPVFDATVLYSELERFDQIYWGLRRVGHLHHHFVDAEQLLQRIDISPKVIRTVGAYNRFTPRPVKKAVSVLSEVAFAVLRRLKRALKP